MVPAGEREVAKKPKPRLSKKQREQIAAIRRKGYSAAYEKRLIRGVEQGKSRQQSRGHVAHEHVIRKEREREANEGITRNEVRSIQNFLSRFDPKKIKGVPNEETLVDFVRENGYDKFVEYRKVWDATRRNYLRELKNGTYASRGIEFLDMLVVQAPVSDRIWYFYH